MASNAWPIRDGATFSLDKAAAYLRDVTFKRTKNREGDMVRVCVLQLMLQPFTPELATLLGVRGDLYAGEKRNDHVRRAVLDLGIAKLPFGVELYAAPDLPTPTIEIDEANIGPTINVRVDTEGPIFSATVDVEFSYPTPADLLQLVNSIGDQWFVSSAPLQTELADVSEDGEAD